MTRVSSEGPSFAKYRFSEIYHLKGGGDIHDWMKGVRLLTYMCDRVMEDIHYLFFIANMPSSRKVLLAMSEAIISRRGGSGGVDVSGVNASPANVLSPYRYVANNGVLVAGTMVNRGSLTRNINAGSSASFSSGYYTGGTIRAVNAAPPATLKTETFVSTTDWVVPNHTGKISVRIFGAGGGGGSGGGGGGGWMNNGDLTIANGTSVHITIGSRGRGNAGTSSLADGGTGGPSSFGIWLSANGGRGGRSTGGGDGSSGGGSSSSLPGGNGYQFGGGGGSQQSYSGGGNGGMWGGGGGGSIAYNSYAGNGGMYGGGGGGGNPAFKTSGIGGAFGGNGGYVYNWNTNRAAENGTNTMSNSSVPANCRGWGRRGTSGNNPGGGGFGGNGGNSMTNARCGGGGGGYGGNGGNANCYSDGSGSGGGGGGGYGKGADGGNGYRGGGGGGGYFARGGHGDSIWGGGGGGGSYGNGGNGNAVGTSGGGGGEGKDGGDGICIVQYYA